MEPVTTTGLAINGGRPARAEPLFIGVRVSDELRAQILELLDTGQPLAGYYGGPQSALLERQFAELHGPGRHAVAVNSGTSALHIALAVAGVGTGDEVIVPSLCFVSAASAVVQLGGIPVICDVEPRTLTIDPQAVERLISPRTKVVLPVHYWGFPADLVALRRICDDRGLVLVEDSCQAPLAPVGGSTTGRFGEFSAFSFCDRKHARSGEGGMVLSADEEAAARIRSLVNFGKGPGWDDYYEPGYSYRMVELSALIVRDGLRKLPEEQAARRTAAAVYRSVLQHTELLPVPDPLWGQSIYFKLPILLPEGSVGERGYVADAVQAENVSCRVPHRPLYEIPWLAELVSRHGHPVNPESFPVTAALFPRLIEVETGPYLSEEDAHVSAGAVDKVWHALARTRGRDA
jgi:dTDP-4-amino-4,6-dideoxygalactose transaminase